ncbi:hypothetical protein GCM10027592_60210 [Spirosoma flavus]
MKRNWYWSFGCFVTFLCLTQSLAAQTLHVVMMAAVDDKNLGAACQSDVAVMTENFKQISKGIGYELNLKQLQNDRFTGKALRAALDSVKPAANDVLVFYYTGQGYNHMDHKSEFPYLKVNDYQASAIDLDEVHQRLKQKGARLSVTMSDCSNELLPSLTRSFTKPVRITAAKISDEDVSRLLQKLFITVKGDVKIAGAERSQYSYAFPGGRGSLYTTSFENAFETALNNNVDLTWASLLEDIQNRLEQIPVSVSAKDTIRQQSIFEVNVTAMRPSANAGIAFNQINKYLNTLADESRPNNQRRTELRTADQLFTPTAHARIYVGNTEVASQNVDQLTRRLYLNAKQIKQVNIIEKLSTFDPVQKRYKVIAVQELWE